MVGTGKGVRLGSTLVGTALAAIALVLPAAGVAQRMVVNGRALGSDGVPIEDATVRLIPVENAARLRTVGTDALGYFAFYEVAAGAYTLEIERIGYARHNRPVHVSERDVALEIALAADAVALPGVSVEAERGRLRARFEDAAGRTAYEIAGTDLKAVPSLVEADPIRAVDVLPGVNTVSDFSAAFNVRGGSADQNLILLDRVPIFNPFHLGGFFSVFNADMVRTAELRSGGFSPEYGGRVSSVLLVESDHGDGRLGADVGVSLLASRIAVNGTLPAGLAEGVGLVNSRWRMSARRSYADVVLSPWADVPYHLVDYQGVFEAWTRGGNRIRLTAYHGKDDVDLGESFRSGTSAASGGDDLPRLLWDWGNSAVGAAWTNPMTGGGHLEVRASWTKFRSNMSFPEFRDRPRFATDVRQLTAGVDLERRPTPRSIWKTGLAAVRARYGNQLPGVWSELGLGSAARRGGDGREISGYTQLQWRPSSRWLLETGVRVDQWRAGEDGGKIVASPRAAAKRFLANRRAAVRLAVGRYSQSLHSLRNEDLPLGIDIWVLAGADVPQVVSDQVQLGFERFIGSADDWFVAAEGYYRTFRGVITRNFIDDPEDPRDDLLSGTGVAYGLDLYGKRDRGAMTGWVSASLLHTRRTFPDTRLGLDPAPEVSFPPVFDRRLDLDLVLRRRLRWGVDAAVRFNFGTGLPYTRPFGRYWVHDHRPATSVLDDSAIGVLLGPRNGHRYPLRHRLDISFRKHVEREWGRFVPYLSILNVYNRKNVFVYFFDHDQTPPTRTGVSMIPFLPTIGVEVSF